jgi:hypothetical protein
VVLLPREEKGQGENVYSFKAFWHLIKGLFISYKLFSRKEGFLISCIVYIKW